MKKLITLTICFVFATAIGFAKPSQETKTEPSRKSEAELGFEISHIKYEEPGIMEEEGMMYGIAGLYANHQNKFMSKLDGRFAYGQVDYKGSLFDGTPYTVDSINDYIVEARLSIGYDFAVSKTAFLTPYIGIGYRYLNDDMSADQYGYERESNYLYSPIGIDAIVSFKNGWSIGLIAEYDLFWFGIQRNHFEDIILGADVTDNEQREGYGAKGSIRIEKKTKAMDFVIEPFMRYWNIEKSDESPISLGGKYIIGWGYEPANNSTEYGIKFALRF